MRAIYRVCAVPIPSFFHNCWNTITAYLHSQVIHLNSKKVRIFNTFIGTHKNSFLVNKCTKYAKVGFQEKNKNFCESAPFGMCQIFMSFFPPLQIHSQHHQNVQAHSLRYVSHQKCVCCFKWNGEMDAPPPPIPPHFR